MARPGPRHSFTRALLIHSLARFRHNPFLLGMVRALLKPNADTGPHATLYYRTRHTMRCPALVWCVRVSVVERCNPSVGLCSKNMAMPDDSRSAIRAANVNSASSPHSNGNHIIDSHTSKSQPSACILLRGAQTLPKYNMKV